MHLIDWQSVLTEHQVHLLRELGRLPEVHLQIVTSMRELDARQAQGWTPPDLSELDVIALSSKTWLADGIRLLRKNRTAHHLFCGLWADRRLFVLLLYARITGCRISLMSEPYSDVTAGLLRDQSGVAGRIKLWLRRAAYRLAGIVLGPAVRPVFAISPKAVAQFTRAGFSPDAICPFGYFVPPSQSQVTPNRTAAPGLRLAFVGGLLRRKGLDIACDAVRAAAAEGIGISLDVYGPGDVSTVPTSDHRIQYCGVIPFGDTQKVLAAYDALLVPSRFDGWAVVVNEALLQAVPVVASDAVGAAAMLRKSGAGFVFASEQPQALAELLKKLAREPAALAAARAGAAAFRDKLLPPVAARYMLDCYSAQSAHAANPACPWY